MFKMFRDGKSIFSGVKKKLKDYGCKRYNLGLRTIMSLILFYFKIEPKTFDEVAKYWSYIETLTKHQILPVANIPLQFK